MAGELLRSTGKVVTFLCSSKEYWNVLRPGTMVYILSSSHHLKAQNFKRPFGGGMSLDKIFAQKYYVNKIHVSGETFSFQKPLSCILSALNSTNQETSFQKRKVIKNWILL